MVQKSKIPNPTLKDCDRRDRGLRADAKHFAGGPADDVFKKMRFLLQFITTT